MAGTCPDRHPVQVCIRYLNGTCFSGRNCVHQHPLNQNGIYKSQIKPQAGQNFSPSSPRIVEIQQDAFVGQDFAPNQTPPGSQNHQFQDFIPGSTRQASDGSVRCPAGQVSGPGANQSPVFSPASDQFSAAPPGNQSPVFSPAAGQFSAPPPSNQSPRYSAAQATGSSTNQNPGNQYSHPSQMMGQGWHQ